MRSFHAASSVLDAGNFSWERRRRNRLIDPAASVTDLPRHMQAPFLNAPFVHPLRNPTNQAQRLRALLFARETQCRVLWSVAFDRRVQPENRPTTNQESWLTKMDRQTAGIPGLFPCILDLPVKFTCEPRPGDRLKGVFTNARGFSSRLGVRSSRERTSRRIFRCRIGVAEEAIETVHRNIVNEQRIAKSRWTTHLYFVQ